MNILNNYIGLLGCLLLLVALPLIIVRRPRYSRRTITVTIVAMLVITVTSVNGLIIPAYIRGVVSDLSITSIILLTYFIATAYTGKAYISATDKKLLALMVLVSAAVIYPFGLGMGPWDGYATGFASPWLYGWLLIVTLWLYLQRRLFIVGMILAGTTAYLFSLLASQNLWDYLIDPILVIMTMFQAAKTGIRQQLHQRRHPNRT